jgi:hypothetical protein
VHGFWRCFDTGTMEAVNEYSESIMDAVNEKRNIFLFSAVPCWVVRHQPQ